ncbi:hypothetical protein FKP32DRAFT_556697 [Trametes sanguinea]|nr:hypothetical protein FKP32DRAFT_556697 [Trametes sanguinea]
MPPAGAFGVDRWMRFSCKQPCLGRPQLDSGMLSLDRSSTSYQRRELLRPLLRKGARKRKFVSQSRHTVRIFRVQDACAPRTHVNRTIRDLSPPASTQKTERVGSDTICPPDLDGAPRSDEPLTGWQCNLPSVWTINMMADTPRSWTERRSTLNATSRRCTCRPRALPAHAFQMVPCGTCCRVRWRRGCPAGDLRDGRRCPQGRRVLHRNGRRHHD